MTRPALIGALFDAWEDLDRVCEGMGLDEALSEANGSAFAWTVAHLANQVDAWINVRCAGAEPDAIVGDARYRFGGDGRARAWDEIREAAASVRERAGTYLQGLTDADLERTSPYPGSLPALLGQEVPLRHTLTRTLSHHYFHIGELATKRSAAGRQVGDYPGPMLRTLEEAR